MHPPAANGVNRVFPNGHSDDCPDGDPGTGSHVGPVPDGDRQGPVPPPSPTANGTNGRDGRGRFAKGNAGGPGNPFARRVAGLRRALLEAVTEEDMEVVARRLVAQAVEGDIAAARLLLSYTLGKPADAVDPDTLDQQEWQLYRQRPVNGQDLLAILSNLPVDLACTILRAALPGVSRGMAGLAAQVIGRDEPAEHKPAPRPRRARERRGPAEGQDTEGAAGTEPGEANGASDGAATPQEDRLEEPQPREEGPEPSPCQPPAAPAQAETPPAAVAERQPPVVADTARPARARLASQGAAPGGVASLRDQDTALLRKLQTLLTAMQPAPGANPRPAPTANGANGGAATGPPVAPGG
jgi:hypothetical protein